MIKVWYFLKWCFSFPGVQFSTTAPYQFKRRGKNWFWLSKHPGVGYLPNGPRSQELMMFHLMEQKFHCEFHRYKCKFCSTIVWSYKPTDICESFTCFAKNGGRWK